MYGTLRSLFIKLKNSFRNIDIKHFFPEQKKIAKAICNLLIQVVVLIPAEMLHSINIPGNV